MISTEGIDPRRQSGGVHRSPPFPALACDVSLSAASAGDRVADKAIDVGALFSLHAPFLLRVAERLTGPGPHVEDLVQEVFIVAHRRRGELRNVPELRGWLYRVTANRAQQHRRSLWRRFRLARAVEFEPAGASAGPDELAARRQRAAQIRAAVLELPFLQREAFVLVELEGLDTCTTASLLGIPEGTVSSRLSTARKLFRQRWTGATS